MRRERRPRGHVTVGTAPASPQTGTEAQRGSLFLESAGPRGPRRLCLSHALEHGLTAAGERGFAPVKRYWWTWGRRAMPQATGPA